MHEIRWTYYTNNCTFTMAIRKIYNETSLNSLADLDRFLLPRLVLLGPVARALRGRQRQEDKRLLSEVAWPTDDNRLCYLGVSLNGGTPKSFILIGFSIINHPFWGTTILVNPHISLDMFWPTFWFSFQPLKDASSDGSTDSWNAIIS